MDLVDEVDGVRQVSQDFFYIDVIKNDLALNNRKLMLKKRKVSRTTKDF